VRPVESAQILLECLRAELATGPYPIADEHICLRFGQDVNPSLGTLTDECCTGLAWARVAGVDGLNDPDSTGAGICINSQRRLTLELGTARCVPYGTTQRPTSCADWTESALKMDADHAAMEAAVCCFRDTVQDMPWPPESIAVTTYQPFGPDGNCLRGTLQLTLDYSCGCGS
jgi:hypothetical protein